MIPTPGKLTFHVPAARHDVKSTEYAGSHEDYSLKTPADNRICRSVTVADSKQAQGKHYRYVPWAETAV